MSRVEIDGVVEEARSSRRVGIRRVGIGLVFTAIFVIAFIAIAQTRAARVRHDAPDLLKSVRVLDIGNAADDVADGDSRMEALAVVDDAVVRVGAVDGARAWHTHVFEDEFVMAIDGGLAIDMRGSDGGIRTVTLKQDQAVMIPAGVTHRVRASDRANMLVFQTSSAVSGVDGAE